jgi:hypothetical protein
VAQCVRIVPYRLVTLSKRVRQRKTPAQIDDAAEQPPKATGGARDSRSERDGQSPPHPR